MRILFCMEWLPAASLRSSLSFPCFLFIFAGAPFIEKTHGSQKIKALLSLITAAVVGVILNLTFYLAQAVVLPDGIDGDFHYMNFAWIFISFLAMFRFKVNMMLWIGISALFSLLVYFIM